MREFNIIINKFPLGHAEERSQDLGSFKCRPPHGFLRKDVSETKNLFEGILEVFLRGSSFSSQSLGFASEVLSTGYHV